MTADWLDPDVFYADVEKYETIELVNGLPGCSSCGSLTVVAVREGGRPLTAPEAVESKMLPEPAADVTRVHCAGCGGVLWEREETEP